MAFLNNKLKEATPYKWNNKEISNIHDIYSDIKQNIMLNYVDINKPFIIETDASKHAIGSVIKQENKIIGIFSKKYTASEANYTNPEKEMLAIIKTVRQFRDILYNSEIIIKTDHINILSKKSCDIGTSRIERWKIELQEQKIKYTYIKGHENIGADFNSRLNQIIETEYIFPWKKINKYQLAQKMIEASDNIIMRNGYEIGVKNNKIYIPENGTEEILKIIHDNLGHPGYVRMYLTLTNKLSVTSLKEAIKRICKTCRSCQLYKYSNRGYGKIIGYIQAKDINEMWSTDIVGPYNTEQFNTDIDNEKFWIITITDVFSRYSKLYILKTLISTETIQIISRHMKSHGKPEKILSDRGKQYTSSAMNKLCIKNGIQHILASRDNPQGNGISERINFIINFTMRSGMGKELQSLINKAETALNIPVHTTLGISPYTCRMQRDPLMIEEKSIQIDKALLRERIQRKSIRNSEKINKARIDHKYVINSKCLMKTEITIIN